LEQLLPITLICGFPRSGKSELVDQLARKASDKRLAFVVPKGHRLLSAAKGLVLPAEHFVLESVDEAVAINRIEGVVFLLSDAETPVEVAAKVRDPSSAVDTVVAVLDARSFLADFSSTQSLGDRGWGPSRLAALPVVEVLTEFVEAAGVVILSDYEGLGKAELDSIHEVLAVLNPRAVVYKGLPEERSACFGLGHFQIGSWWKQTAWAQALLATENGFSSKHAFVFRARRPFHPGRFHSWLQVGCGGALRAQGRFWLASRLEWVGLLSQAGAAVRTEPKGYWWAVVPPEEWPDDPLIKAEIDRYWDPLVGDCRQELSFAGILMDQAKILAELEGCLLTEEEMASGPHGWSGLTDPFPVWSEAELS
jgi:G3E family GTPase